MIDAEMVRRRPMPFAGMPIWNTEDDGYWSTMDGHLVDICCEQWRSGDANYRTLPGEPGCPPLPERMRGPQSGYSGLALAEEWFVGYYACGYGNVIPVPADYAMRTVSDTEPAEVVACDWAATLESRERAKREREKREMHSRLINMGHPDDAESAQAAKPVTVQIRYDREDPAGEWYPGKTAWLDAACLPAPAPAPTHCPRCRTETSAHPLTVGRAGMHCDSCGWPAMERKPEPEPKSLSWRRRAPGWAEMAFRRFGLAKGHIEAAMAAARHEPAAVAMLTQARDLINAADDAIWSRCDPCEVDDG